MFEFADQSFRDDGISKAADQEPCPAIQACGGHAYLYAATCPALQAWSEKVGFEVVHMGIAADPLRWIARLRSVGHAALSYFLRPSEGDRSFGDWHLVPIDLSAAAAGLPDRCDNWGGTIRISLPAGASPEDLARRLAIMLRPLEAPRGADVVLRAGSRAA